jgi:hypothetical protein
MDDYDVAVRPYRVRCLFQQSLGELAVKNVKQQRGVEAARWQAEAFSDNIAMPANDVV